MKKKLPCRAGQLMMKIMGWTAALWGIFGLAALSAVAGPVSGQSPLEKKVTLHLQQAPLKDVLEEISEKTGVSFMYGGEVAQSEITITFSSRNQSIKEVLQKILMSHPFEFKVVGDKILVYYNPEKKPEAAPARQGSPPKQIRIDTLTGKVTDSTGAPLPGVAVRVLSTSKGTQTDGNGVFKLMNIDQEAILSFSLLGFHSQELSVNGRNTVHVTMRMHTDELREVTVVSTGYQEIPQERATGSFTKVNNELFNRRVSTNIIDRLEGVTSSLIFNRNYLESDPNASPISIRGLSTIFANTRPLIVVDNFPFDGDLENLNPNDVESITVLKDAAAASIWGARSGNGVIVITTRKGRMNRPLSVSFNANYTYTQKPDISYDPNFMESSDFIDAEQFLFSKGYYDAQLNSTTTRPVISPVVELLAQERDGVITAQQAQAGIEALRNKDIREDLSKYFYRSTGTQQYSLNLSGGSNQISYYFSAGFDDVPSVLEGNSYSRITLNSASTITPVKDLVATIGLNFTQTQSLSNNPGNLSTIGKSRYYPYADLADDNGNPLDLPKDYRYAYISSLGTSQLLDWTYRPLDELMLADNTAKSSYVRFNTSLKYPLFSGLSAELRYQLERQNSSMRNFQSQESYFTRNLINLYSQSNDGGLIRAIPLGGVLDQSTDQMTGQSIRAQLNYDGTISEDHKITAIAGIDGKELNIDQDLWRLYGYNDLIGTSVPVDYNTIFSKYSNLAFSGRIPYSDRVDKLTDIFFSYFANASYTYLDRYTLSGSGRIDQSNLFGVNTNQKSVPLWSIGGAWEISKEDYYGIEWLPYLKLRGTYGYNGNIDKTVSAYTTAVFTGTSFLTSAPYVIIQNPPNPELRWERIGMINVGFDFRTTNNTFSGSIEYYHKNGRDILGYAPLDPTTGVDEFKGNVADIKANGLDIDLKVQVGGALKWYGAVLLSTSKEKVTSYNTETTLGAYLQASDGSTGLIIPYTGHPVFSVASYNWAGLDPATGDPRGYLNGEVSKDYAAIRNSPNLEDAVFHGSARPTVFGALRNTFTYKGFSISANITYKLGYYFRRTSINYLELASPWRGHPDYASRWQHPGDEAITDVPSFTYPLNSSRETFYQYSKVLVEKGDHIRLQDIQVGYDFSGLDRSLPFKQLQAYLYINNLGIIWKATETAIDPDYIRNSTYTPPQTFALGIKTTF